MLCGGRRPERVRRGGDGFEVINGHVGVVLARVCMSRFLAGLWSGVAARWSGIGVSLVEYVSRLLDPFPTQVQDHGQGHAADDHVWRGTGDTRRLDVIVTSDLYTTDCTTLHTTN
jgi:hypothetical protein